MDSRKLSLQGINREMATRKQMKKEQQEANQEGERGIREVKEDPPMTKHMSPETLAPHESGLG